MLFGKSAVVAVVALVGCSDTGIEDPVADQRTWSASEIVATALFNSIDSTCVAINVEGIAVAVWSGDGIWSSRKLPHEAWSEPELISMNNAGQLPRIGIDDTGNAIAVWLEGTKPEVSIWSNRFDRELGWQAATQISSIEPNEDPALEIDATGNALVAWSRDEAGGVRQLAAPFSEPSGWGSAVPLAGQASQGAKGIALDMNDDGEAVAVWSQSNGNGTQIYASRYNPASGWKTSVQLATGEDVGPFPDVAINVDGVAVAGWRQEGTVAVSRYDGSSWNAIEQMGSSVAEAPSRVQIGLDDRGDAVALWSTESAGQTGGALWANRLLWGSGWEGAEKLSSEGSSLTATIAVERDGRAVVVWHDQYVAALQVLARRYPVDGSWGPIESLAPGGIGFGISASMVASNRAGAAIAIWHERDDMTDTDRLLTTILE
jgi:hypothetical protein